jgi:PAS domain S-box-containing protein
MKVPEFSRPAIRTAAYFFVFGFFWILFSDMAVQQFALTHQMEGDLQTYKGWFFIIITTTLIFFVVKQQLKNSMKLKNKLTGTEHRYQEIVNNIHDVIWSADTDGLITFINNASVDVYGYPPEEMIGRQFLDFVPTEQYLKNQKIFENKLKEGLSSAEYETVVIHKNGQKVYLKDTIFAVYDDLGNITSVEGSSTNITAFRTYEKQLLESNQRLELAMHSGEIGLWDYYNQSRKIIINEHWKSILDFEREVGDVDLDFLAALVHPEDIDAVRVVFKNLPETRDQYFVAEYRMRHANGSYRWITSKGKVTEYVNHQPVRMMGAIIDTTEKKNLELELKNLVKLYSSFITYSNEGIYLFEMNEAMPIDLPLEEQIERLYHQGYIRTCNDAFARMYGFESGSQMVGTDQATLHGGDDDPDNIELLRRFIKADYRIINDVTREIDKEGQPLYISNSVVGIIENGKLLRTWGSQQNITGQVLARQKTEESEKRYRLLFETNPVPLFIFCAKTFVFFDVNRETEKLLDYHKKELLSMSIRDLVPAYSGFSDHDLDDLFHKEHSHLADLVLKAKSGKQIPCEVKFDQIDYRGKMAIFGAVNDMTLIKDAEKMVIQSLIEGADNERSRVAKEIHDGLGQSLTAASLNMNSVYANLKNANDKNAEKLENGIRFLKAAIDESRNIAHNLMPQAIEDYGIVLSLKSLFNQIEKSTKLKIKFYENIGEIIRLDINVELNIFRITQEAVNNVIKHSEATEIFVQLMLHANEIIFTFEDNGKGFDRLDLGSGKKGIGVKSMYNRAKAMSGHCDLESSPGHGTTITIVIPIEQ